MKGHVRERPEGSGNWYAVLSIRDQATGKRKLKWHSLKDCTGKRDAEKRCRELVAQHDAGTYVAPDKVTVAAYLEQWLTHMQSQVSPGTHERYGELVRKNIAPLVGSVLLHKLRPEQVSAAYAASLTTGRRDKTGGLSPQTVTHMHRVLKQALGQAVRWSMLTRNPCDAVTPPRVQRKAMQVYDVPALACAIDALRNSRLLIPVLLAGTCGLRRGEAVAVRWRDVDFETGNLAVSQSAEQTKAGVRYKAPKSGKPRRVALSQVIIAELRAWRIRQAEELLALGVRQGPDTFVITKATGEPLQPRSITHEWVRLCKVHNLPRIRFHDLRHSHATHLLAENVHPKIASERLGHSKVGITLDLYSHILPTMQAEAADKVDNVLRLALTKQKPVG